MPGYMGDKKSKLVHHLANQKQKCNIYSIEKKDRRYFMPDTLEKAKELGFKECNWCN